jgi:POT family proton-dependent oligopeptide transporter
MIAVYYVHLFIGNLLTGYLGGLLGTMSNSTFWFMHAVLMGISAIILLAVRFMFAHVVAPSREDIAMA